MSVPLSCRLEALAALEAGETGESIATRLGIGRGSIYRWRAMLAAHGSAAPRPQPPRSGPTPKEPKPRGRRPSLSEADRPLLLELVAANPYARREVLRAMVAERTGKEVTAGALTSAMRKWDIQAVHPVVLDRPSPGAPAAATPTRYTDAHRRERVGDLYPSSLTDAEWTVVGPLVTRETGPGRKPLHAPRHMLDAVFYVLRTGCSWRMLPSNFPKWESVYASFRRWNRSGVIERVYDRLGAMWRERQGRNTEASAGIVDSQSVKTTEKGGPAATTAARKSSVASATSWSTQRGC